MMRRAENKDIEQCEALWHTVFGDCRRDIALFFCNAYPKCDAFVCESDGRVVSMLFALPCTLYDGGKAHCARYIYAAATEEKHRGRGYMSSLIRFAHSQVTGADCFLLIPASESLVPFYERLGYRCAFGENRVTLTPCVCDADMPDCAALCNTEPLGVAALPPERAQELRDALMRRIDGVSWNGVEDYVNLFYEGCGYRWYLVGNGVALVRCSGGAVIAQELLCDDIDAAVRALCSHFGAGSVQCALQDQTGKNLRGMLWHRDESTVSGSKYYVNLYLE